MSWRTVSLGEVANVGAGNSAPQEDRLFENGTHNFYRTSDVGRIRTGVISESSDKLNSDGIRGLKLHSIGTILFPKSGASTFLNHRVMLGKEGYVSSHLATIKAKADVANDKFLLYFLSTIDAKNLVQDSNYPSLKTSVIEKIIFSLPPLTTQQKIVAKLDAIFAEIDKATAAAEANAKNAEALFQSYLTQVFERQKENNTLTTLGEYYDVRDGTHDSPKFYESGYPLVTSKNLKNGSISFEKIQYISKEDYLSISQRSGVKKGDVLMAMIGTIGNPVVVETDDEFAIKNVALFKTNNNQSPLFLRYYLGSDYVKRKMESDAKGATQKFVGLGYLRSFPISVPVLSNQLSIVRELNEYEQHTNRLFALYVDKTNQFLAIKQSILKKAFAGELVKE